jgi:hypothetical protein
MGEKPQRAQKAQRGMGKPLGLAADSAEGRRWLWLRLRRYPYVDTEISRERMFAPDCPRSWMTERFFEWIRSAGCRAHGKVGEARRGGLRAARLAEPCDRDPPIPSGALRFEGRSAGEFGEPSVSRDRLRPPLASARRGREKPALAAGFPRSCRGLCSPRRGKKVRLAWSVGAGFGGCCGGVPMWIRRSRGNGCLPPTVHGGG